MTRRSARNEGIQADNVNAEVIAVGKQAHAEQHKTVHAAGADQLSLDDLLGQLRDALAQVPAEHQEEAEAVEALSQDLVQSSDPETANKTLLEIKGESLKKAAQNLADVMPTVLVIATQIVNQVLTLGA